LMPSIGPVVALHGRLILGTHAMIQHTFITPATR
jgi:hypothetical protein